MFKWIRTEMCLRSRYKNYTSIIIVKSILLTIYAAVKFLLNGRMYYDGDTILMSDIGEEDDALLCVTEYEDCCSNPIGEFYYPDGTAVGFSSTNSLYRNRDEQLVRLNRRGDVTSPLGRYRCAIPDDTGTTTSIYINILSKPA